MLEHAKRGYAAAKAAGAFREIGATGGNGASVTTSCSIISAELMVAGLCHMSLFQQMAGYELMAKGCRTAQVAAEPQRRPGRPQACSARDRTSRRPAWFAGCELLGGLGRLIEKTKDLSSALARPWPVKSARISSRTQPHPTKKAGAKLQFALGQLYLARHVATYRLGRVHRAVRRMPPATRLACDASTRTI